MCARLILALSAVRAGESDRTALIRSRIGTLMRDPSVIERVRRRLESATARRSAALPASFTARRDRDRPGKVGRLARVTCRESCSSIDCLCGRLPTQLTKQDIENARRPERIGA